MSSGHEPSPREQVLQELLTDWSQRHERPADGGGTRPELRPGPRYVQLAGVLQAAMEDGRLAPGAKLPPERTLAETLGVSRGTVVSAYDVLRERGLVAGRRGSGTWVREDLAFAPGFGRAPSKPRSAPHEVISFSMANLPALRPVLETVMALGAQDLQEPMATHGYHSFGLLDLREQIAAYYTQQGLPTSVEQVLVTTGAQQAISLVASHLVQPGDSAVVEDPTYLGTINAVRAAGGGTIPVAITEEGVDVEALRRIVGRVRPRFVYLIPVHNPTGVVATTEVMREIADIVSVAGTTVVEDRTLSQLTFGRPAPPPLASRIPVEQGITVESLSKIFWGGLRVGWVRGPANVIDHLAKQKTTVDLASPVLSQLVGARLLPKVDAMRDLVIPHVTERLDHMERLLQELLPTWQWTRPAGGLSLWVRIPRGGGAQFLQHAAQYGVTGVPGTAMSPGGRFTDYLRLAYVLDEAEMEAGIQRLAAAWNSYESIARDTPSFTVVV